MPEFYELPMKLRLITILPLCAMVIVALIALLALLRHSVQNDNSPIVSVNVKLMKKKRIRHRHYTELLFFFLTENEELLEFSVGNSLDFDIYNEGDTGVLTYRGTRFLKFERNHINLK